MFHFFDRLFRQGFYYLLVLGLLFSIKTGVAQTDLETLKKMDTETLKHLSDEWSGTNRSRIDAIYEAERRSSLDTELMRSPVYTKRAYRAAKEWPKYLDHFQETYAQERLPGSEEMDEQTLTESISHLKKGVSFGVDENNFKEQTRGIKDDPITAFIHLSESVSISPEMANQKLFEPQNQQDAPVRAQTASASTSASAPASARNKPSGGTSIQAVPQQDLKARHYQILRTQYGHRSFPINLKGF